MPSRILGSLFVYFSTALFRTAGITDPLCGTKSLQKKSLQEQKLQAGETDQVNTFVKIFCIGML